ncbi:MAG: response regulator transcription factor [Pseudoxanthomonas sp.]
MTQSALSILIVEDNSQLAANLYDYMEACGHHLDAAPDGISGLHLASTRRYDAIVLDWNLPRLDGLTFLQRLRREAGNNVPVFMLTARDQLEDKMRSFESGVDEYLVKPIALPELEIRVRSYVERVRGFSSADRTLRTADLAFNLGTMEAHRGARKIPLSRTGRRLLEVLMRESPTIVSRERLEEAAWGDASPDKDLLRSHMSVLRRGLEQEGEARLLHNVSGVGYRLCEIP